MSAEFWFFFALAMILGAAMAYLNKLCKGELD